jgi:hypothetical protein
MALGDLRKRGITAASAWLLRLGGAWHVIQTLAVCLLFAWMTQALLHSFFVDLGDMGFHDWDAEAGYRYITTVSLKRYHELPWWHPWLCGGFPAWAYSEGAPNVVSPYLPAYLLLPIQIAIRVESVGDALLGLFGTYLLAGRFTRSVALRALVAVVATLNGRWALQITSGHMWHLQYAWLPFALYFFDRSFEPGRLRHAVYAAMFVALMVYTGGVYPITHSALLFVIYALVVAALRRSRRPLIALAIAGPCALGFSAPKLLPVLDLMRRFPRKVDSTEALNLGQLAQMLVNPNQSFHVAPVSVPMYGWHEWGIYVGLPACIAMGIAVLFGRSWRQQATRAAGLVFFVLGLGAFDPQAPWTLLHKLPIFSSQHAPSRFFYVGVLLLMLAFAAFAARWVDRSVARAPLLDVALLLPVYLIAANLVQVGRLSTDEVFYLEFPAALQRSATFHQVRAPSQNYSPAGAWAGPTVLAMMENAGFVTCYSVPDRGEPRGAIAQGDPDYAGEAYFADGGGNAAIISFSPNRAVVEFDGAKPGATLVYNMNYDPSWRANGRPALEYKHAVATTITSSSGRVEFRYYPRTMNAALFVFALTAFAAYGLPQIIRRRRLARRGR